MQSWVCSAKSRAGSRMIAETLLPDFWRFFVDSYWFWSFDRPARSWGHCDIGTKPSFGNFSSEKLTASCAFRIDTQGNSATPCKAGGNGAKAFAERLPVDVEAATTTFHIQIEPAPARSASRLARTALQNGLMDTSRVDGVKAPLHDGTQSYARHDVALAVFGTVVVELAVVRLFAVAPKPRPFLSVP